MIFQTRIKGLTVRDTFERTSKGLASVRIKLNTEVIIEKQDAKVLRMHTYELTYIKNNGKI